MDEMVRFRVVKEPYGWAVRTGRGMMTPFRSRGLAIEHASTFVETLRRNGEPAEIVLEEVGPLPPPSVVARDRLRFRP